MPVSKTLVIGALLALAALAYYSLTAYKSSGIEEKGVEIQCRDGVCKKAVHIHSALSVSICGKEFELPKDEGKLDDIHSHKQSNVLHFHHILEFDESSKELLTPEPLLVKTAVKALFNLKLINACIGDKCNGDRCPSGKTGRLELRVVDNFCKGDSCPDPDKAPRGRVVENIEDFVWEDGQFLRLTFE